MNDTGSESARQRALDKLKAVDTATNPLYDDVTRIAATVCDAPIALVSLIDRDRQWFKAKTGLDLAQTPRSIAVCDHAIREPDEVFEVSDLAQDPRFADFPYVADGTARFYAGMPMTTADGDAVGTVCVLDAQPRQLTDEQRDALEALSRVTMALLEADCRRHYRKAADAVEPAAQGEAAQRAEPFHLAIVRLDRLAEAAAERGERATEKLVATLVAELESCTEPKLGDYLDRVSDSPEIVAVLRGPDDEPRLDRLRAAADRFASQHRLSLHVGVAEADSADENLMAVYLRADEALSRARDAAAGNA